MSHKTVQKKLKKLADPKKAEHSQRFFKTSEGEYGEGDQFLGIRVPEQRTIAKAHKNLPLDEVEQLLQSSYHEERLTALLILTYKFPKADHKQQEAIYRCYMNNLDQVNNWDLVDSSAHKIVGAYLEQKDRSVLHQLADSEDLWRRRIAMMSCMQFVKEGDFKDALNVARKLLNDDEDLIHKAVGWLLREIGKKDLETEERFLQANNYKEMPRTMLRYAIEKFPEEKRQAYLAGTI